MSERRYILPGTPDSRRTWMACSYHHRRATTERIGAAILYPTFGMDDPLLRRVTAVQREVVSQLRWRSIYVGTVPLFDDGERLIVKDALDIAEAQVPTGSRHAKARQCVAAAREYLIDLGLAGVEPPQARPCGDRCPRCHADHWRISATLIECAACETQWGRVNGLWMELHTEATVRCSRCGCMLSDHDTMDPHGCTACECAGWED